MLALQGEAGRASPETVAWPCDTCLSLGPLENEGTVLNLCSRATLQKKKGNKEPKRSYLWVILARWDNDWPFVKPHTVLSCVDLCFTLANSQRELITAFLTAGVGGKGLWLHSRGLAGPYHFGASPALCRWHAIPKPGKAGFSDRSSWGEMSRLPSQGRFQWQPNPTGTISLLLSHKPTTDSDGVKEKGAPCPHVVHLPAEM